MDCLKVETQDQLEQCLNIRLEVFVHEQGVPEDLEVDEYDQFNHPDCTHVLALANGISSATGRFIRYQSGAVKFQRIAVLKAFRRTGMGSRLLTAMERMAQDAGYHTIILDSQCQAEAFYLKHGYQVENPNIFMDAGIQHVRMVKPLNP